VRPVAAGRKGPVHIVRGIPYTDRATSLSLIPGAALGEWLADHAGYIHGRLLDLGCGNRPFLPWYGPLVDEAVWTDAEAAPGVSVVADGGGLPFRDASFDTILCTEVIEHVTDAEATLAEMFRTTRPGGHVLVSVPFLYPVHEAPFDMRRFTHFGLRDILERHGFEVVSIESKGGFARLALHFLVLAVVTGLGALTRIGPLRRLIALPQEILIRARPTRRGLTGTAGRLSLGYMAVATKPAPGAPEPATEGPEGGPAG
jgi:SAM-dependent methyltransferase